MAPKRKRMKLKEPETQELDNELVTQELDNEPDEDNEQPVQRKRKGQISLTSLNDDCIYAIFSKLSLSNLCAVSKTCRRLQVLASNQFMRCHKSKVMNIQGVTDDGDLVVCQKDEKYMRCFGKSIQNVTFGKSLAMKSVLREVNKGYRFKKTDKMAPIKTLRIDGWRRGLRMSHRPSLANLVQDVESITVANTKIFGDLNECLLKHIPNMKRLTLSQNIEVEEGTDTINWMQQMYPNLEYFAWHADSNIPVAELKQLLELNPNITFVSLYAKSQNTLDQLMAEGIRIDELYIDVKASIMTTVFQNLRLLCEQQFCKRLHLKFADSVRSTLTRNLNQFILLGPYIEGLYFEKSGIDANLARTIMTFDHLKVLQLNLAVNASILSKALNLEEIFAYWGVDRSNFKHYQAALITYAENTPTLKKIYMRNNSQPFERFEFVELDLARKELAGAKKLKVYFKTEECSFTGKLNAVNCDYDMVEIVRVETEHVANPLITEYLTTKELNRSPWLDSQYSKYSRY